MRHHAVRNITITDMVVCFLLGNSPASEFYMPTFRNTLFHLHRRIGMKDWNQESVICIKTFSIVTDYTKHNTTLRKQITFVTLCCVVYTQRRWKKFRYMSVIFRMLHRSQSFVWCGSYRVHKNPRLCFEPYLSCRYSATKCYLISILSLSWHAYHNCRIKVSHSSETMAPVYQTAWLHISEGSILYIRRHENVESCKAFLWPNEFLPAARFALWVSFACLTK